MSEDSAGPDHESALVFDRFVDETLSIARKGEGRAGTLDVVGGALIVVAVLLIIVTLSVVLGTGDNLSAAERIAIGASGVGGAISSLVGAAMFSGFAALVRNSSRTLELLTLDSSLIE